MVLVDFDYAVFEEGGEFFPLAQGVVAGFGKHAGGKFSASNFQEFFVQFVHYGKALGLP